MIRSRFIGRSSAGVLLITESRVLITDGAGFIGSHKTQAPIAIQATAVNWASGAVNLVTMFAYAADHIHRAGLSRRRDLQYAADGRRADRGLAKRRQQRALDNYFGATMMEGLRDIIGILMMLGLILLIRRILGSFFLRKPQRKTTSRTTR
jgi:hypothetical protein